MEAPAAWVNRLALQREPALYETRSRSPCGCSLFQGFHLAFQTGKFGSGFGIAFDEEKRRPEQNSADGHGGGVILGFLVLRPSGLGDAARQPFSFLTDLAAGEVLIMGRRYICGSNIAAFLSAPPRNVVDTAISAVSLFIVPRGILLATLLVTLGELT